MRILIIPVLLSLSISVYAQEAEPKPAEAEKEPMSEAAFFSKYRTYFNKVDTDYNGQITKHEIGMAKFEAKKDDYKKKFKNLDTNYDDYLSLGEIRAWHENNTEQRIKTLESSRDNILKRYDLNGDGNISSYELDEVLAKQVQNYRDGVESNAKRDMKSKDKDESGSVSLEEYIQSKAPNPKIRQSPTGPQPVLVPDQNLDGIISRTELEDFLGEIFKSLDKNNDGELSPREQKHLDLIRFL